MKWVSVALRRPPSPARVFHSPMLWTPPRLCVELVLCVAPAYRRFMRRAKSSNVRTA